MTYETELYNLKTAIESIIKDSDLINLERLKSYLAHPMMINTGENVDALLLALKCREEYKENDEETKENNKKALELILDHLGDNIPDSYGEKLFTALSKLERDDTSLTTLDKVINQMTQTWKQELFSETLKRKSFDIMKILLNKSGDDINQDSKEDALGLAVIREKYYIATIILTQIGELSQEFIDRAQELGYYDKIEALIKGEITQDESAETNYVY